MGNQDKWTNCRIKECILISKRGSSKYGIGIINVKIKQGQEFNYLGSEVTDDGNSDLEIQSYLKVDKDICQKLTNTNMS